MTYPSAAIANAFVDLNGGPMPQMKLHKLAYIAHGWNLAIRGEALVEDSPEAWDNGPVFRLIWDRIRDFGTDNSGRVLKLNGKPFKANLSDDEDEVIRHVWKKYKGYSAFTLSDMTHRKGTPWTETYFTYGRNATIEDSVIKKHYVQLALAGRERK